MGISRRGFVKMAGLFSLSSKAEAIKPPFYQLREERPRYVLIGDFSSSPGVKVYRVENAGWRLTHHVGSEAPVAVAADPSGNFVYVLNGVAEYKGLPRGSVESYGLDRGTGRLELLGREPLALSAIRPRSMAVSPDGRTLLVAVDGGGAYNQLPILADGRLGRVSGIFKETGRGPVAGHQDSARPQAVCFDGSGKRMFASDLGCDRLSVYAVRDGLGLEGRHQLREGSGPRHLQYAPARGLIFVAHALQSGISTFAYDEMAGVVTEFKREPGVRAGDGMLLHPSGAYLVAAEENSLEVWRVGGGGVARTDQRILPVRMAEDAAHGLTFVAGGQQLIALTSAGVMRFEFDAKGGRLRRSELIARCRDARSILCL